VTPSTQEGAENRSQKSRKGEEVGLQLAILEYRWLLWWPLKGKTGKTGGLLADKRKRSTSGMRVQKREEFHPRQKVD